MSNIIRALLRDPYFAYELRPRFGVVPSDFFYPANFYRPWQIAQEAFNELNEAEGVMKLGKDGFQARVDVQHFKPEEIKVKTVDNTVIVEGKHEERDDAHGTVERSFVRKYVLPKEYDMNTVQSTLSSDGVLTIKAPPPAIEGRQERNIEITHTNAPARESIKDKSQNEEKK